MYSFMYNFIDKQVINLESLKAITRGLIETVLRSFFNDAGGGGCLK